MDNSTVFALVQRGLSKLNRPVRVVDVFIKDLEYDSTEHQCFSTLIELTGASLVRISTLDNWCGVTKVPQPKPEIAERLLALLSQDVISNAFTSASVQDFALDPQQGLSYDLSVPLNEDDVTWVYCSRDENATLEWEGDVCVRSVPMILLNPPAFVPTQ